MQRNVDSFANLDLYQELESAGFFGGLSGGGEAGALDAFEIDFPSEE